MKHRNLTVDALQLEATRAWKHADALGADCKRRESSEREAAIAPTRKLARRTRAEAETLWDAAKDLRECGRTSLFFECMNGHQVITRKSCKRAFLCRECSRGELARLNRIYRRRAKLVLDATGDHIRARFLTLTLRTPEAGEDGPQYQRLRKAAAQFWRVVWGVPHSAQDWARYFEWRPLTSREIARTRTHTKAGKLRGYQSRIREARAARKRKVIAYRKADRAGGVVGYEFGPKTGNPHAHWVVVGPYHDWRELRRVWELVTGDSKGVDIRKVRRKGVKSGLREAIKYGTDVAQIHPQRLAQLYAATLTVSLSDKGDRARQHRRVEAFGSLRAKADGEDAIAPQPPVCPDCGEDMRAVGQTPYMFVRYGLDYLPAEFRFRRGPPADKAA